MNPTLILTIVIGVLSLVDFISKDKKFQSIVYTFAFIFFYFFVSIKYYYGSDISNYVPYFENLKNPLEIFNAGLQNTKFEVGFELFCSVIKSAGFSFWWMTFIISSFYFYTIYRVFNKLSGYKTFALLVLVYFEYNLFFFQYRQSISVCFFILSFLAYDEKKYFKYIIFIFLASTFHKSGMYISICSFLILSIKSLEYKRNFYLLLLLLLMIFVFVPLKPILLNMANWFPIDKSALGSISQHLVLTKNIQIIALLYFLILYTIYFCGYKGALGENWHRLMILFFSFIVLLYQDFFILNRIRSFFIPIAIVYVINILSDKKVTKGILYRQLLTCVFFITGLIAAIKLDVKEKRLVSNVNQYTTIFELLNKPEWQIKKEKIIKAKIYWKKDFLKKE